MTRDEALASGYNWKDDIAESREVKRNADIDGIVGQDKYNFEVLKDKIFACDSCQRNYRLVNHEVGFYRAIRNFLFQNNVHFVAIKRAWISAYNEFFITAVVCVIKTLTDILVNVRISLKVTIQKNNQNLFTVKSVTKLK